MENANQQPASELLPPSEADRRAHELGKSIAGKLVREHPTLVLTLAYLALTVVGLIHDLWFFLYFRINILDFSETGDFLLAAIRNPLVILLSMVPLAMLAIIARLREIARRKSRRYEAYHQRYESTRWSSPNLRLGMSGVFIFVYAVLFTQLYAEAMANRVKAGKGRRVTFQGVAGTPSPERPILLGSTAKFLFLYYPARRLTEIVPVENTAMLTVDARSRMERARDSVTASKRIAAPLKR